jgi:stage II sporulation protein P
MRRKNSAARQAVIYLLLLAITPFMCTAFVSFLPKPGELITNAAIDSAAMYLSPMDKSSADAIPAAGDNTTTDTAQNPTLSEQKTPRSFRVITDDSFITNSPFPSSKNEDVFDIDNKDNTDDTGNVTDGDTQNDTDTPDNSSDNSDSSGNSSDDYFKLSDFGEFSLLYPDTDGIIDIVTYGEMAGNDYINLSAGQIRNLTDMDNKAVSKSANMTPAFTLLCDGTPEILIYHTHATESYLPFPAAAFDTDYPFRSLNESINMVAVGNAITMELEAAGFGVIHDKTLYDAESYTGAYENSRAGVKAILDENPGIKIVLDVHRDALIKSDSEIVAPTVNIDGADAAQIMIVSNCDGDSLKYPIPQFRENLTLASLLTAQAETLFPGLMRPVLFDYRQYNQDLSTGSLLIEIGGHGNSIDQALYAGKLFGKGLAEALKTLCN